MLPNGGYRLVPQDNGKFLSAHQYSQKLIDTMLQIDFDEDRVLSRFHKVIEKIHANPTRVRELADILERLIYLTSSFHHEQALFNKEIVNFLRGHQHKMTMTTE